MKRTVNHYLIVAAALGLAGCGTLPGGALAGKTSYDVQFSDTTADQDTQYRMKIKAPAGADLASITGMVYDWNPDGTGHIAVSQDQTTDTTAQADALVQSTAQSMAAMSSIMDKFMDIIGPLMTTYADAEVRKGEIKAGVATSALEKLPDLRLRGAVPQE